MLQHNTAIMLLKMIVKTYKTKTLKNFLQQKYKKKKNIVEWCKFLKMKKLLRPFYYAFYFEKSCA